MDDFMENIRRGTEVRAGLIALRKQLKEDAGEQALKGRLLGDQELMRLLAELLKHEDPKVRKNAALILGELKQQGMIQELFAAYEREDTLFIRRDYLKAMELLDCSGYVEEFKRHLEELTGQEITEENRKHYREEINQLQKMVLKAQAGKTHVFTGETELFDVLLTTNRSYREITAGQVKGAKASLTSLGVKVSKTRVSGLFEIRTFRELLFPLNVNEVEADPGKAARQLADSNLPKLLKLGHGAFDEFRFRLTIMGRMPLDKRSDFIKKCAFELEQCTGRRLVNSASDYELEVRLMERRDGTFLPLVKLYTLKDERFAYRKESIAASIHPSDAALIAALTIQYLKKDAQVLDPFCGVGTMLLERDRAVKAGSMYGIDLFGEAIRKARENTARTGREIYYVHRDFFTFTHEYLFDEIFTNMPVRGKKTREEQERLYEQFFAKAGEVLKPGGVMILYSNEKGYIKKQLRLLTGWRLLDEFCLNEKEDFSVFVIGRRK